MSEETFRFKNLLTRTTTNYEPRTFVQEEIKSLMIKVLA